MRNRNAITGAITALALEAALVGAVWLVYAIATVPAGWWLPGGLP